MSDNKKSKRKSKADSFDKLVAKAVKATERAEKCPGTDAAHTHMAAASSYANLAATVSTRECLAIN